MNSEKIAEFLDRMKVDMYFQSYYLSLYDTLRLLNKRIFDFPLLVVIEAEKKWSLKLDHVLDKEHRTLERCEDKIVVRRDRVAYLEVKADDLEDRNLWRFGMPALPTWKQKAKKHNGKSLGEN